MEPHPSLAAWAEVEDLWLKREDLNPTGSHKDRGAVEQIRGCLRRRQRVAVISSSGNAALAAAAQGAANGVTVVALLSPRTEQAKVNAVRNAGGRVVITTRPINFTIRLSRVCGWPDLRPSQSADALRGFEGLGHELAEELVDGVALVGYASSGTTYEAVATALTADHRRLPLHPVQAGLVNGLSRAFGRPGDGRRSIVGDLGAKLTVRAEKVVQQVRDSGGQAWWVDDAVISEAGDQLRRFGFAVVPECWAALAGLRLAARQADTRHACLLLTGRALPAVAAEAAGPPLETFAEVLQGLEDLR